MCSPTSTLMQSNYFCIFLGSFRDLFVAGEHMDKDTMSWTRKAVSAPVYDNWWQTGRVILDLLTHLGIEVIYLNGIFSRFILLCEDLLAICSTSALHQKFSLRYL